MAHKKSKRKKIFGIIFAGITLIAACVVYFIFTKQDDPQNGDGGGRDYSRANQEVGRIRGGEVTGEAVAQYGPYFDEAVGEVTTSDPSGWDQSMIDKALLCIQYAALIGATSQAEAVHTQLQTAEQSGKDIFQGTGLSWDHLNEYAAQPVTSEDEVSNE